MIAFTKTKLPYGWLGNMAPFPVTYGQAYRTTEALFQALRFAPETATGGTTIRELIRLERSPMGAKFIAKAHKDQMSVLPLSERDVMNMRLVLRLKVDQHLDLAQQLLDTGDELIVEDVTSRPHGNNLFWGATVNGQTIGTGRNVLGALWMQLREELRVPTTDKEDA